MRQSSNFARRFKPLRPVTPPVAKIPLATSGKSVAFLRAVLPYSRGAYAQSPRTLGAGCDGRVGVARRATPIRTAKSCGPDPPTLGSSFAGDTREATAAIKPGTPGRARISRNTIAQGVPVDPAEPVVLPPALFVAGGPWVRPSPGIPCALSFPGAMALRKTRADRAAGMLMPAFLDVVARAGGRPGIPEASVFKPTGHGVLDAPHARGMTAEGTRYATPRKARSTATLPPPFSPLAPVAIVRPQQGRNACRDPRKMLG